MLSPRADLGEFGLALLTAIWGVLVWGFFGGASARVAMLDLARRERVGIGGAMKFAGKRLLPLVGAPLSPLIGLAFFASLCGVFGLVWYRFLGEVGETIGGVLFFLPLIAGLVMALIVVGLAVGWPLMVQTVAAESQDAFDALSRSYSYVYQRPWKLGFYVLVSLFVGAVGYAFVLLVATLTIRLALWGVTFGGSVAGSVVIHDDGASQPVVEQTCERGSRSRRIGSGGNSSRDSPFPTSSATSGRRRR